MKQIEVDELRSILRDAEEAFKYQLFWRILPLMKREKTGWT